LEEGWKRRSSEGLDERSASQRPRHLPLLRGRQQRGPGARRRGGAHEGQRKADAPSRGPDVRKPCGKSSVPTSVWLGRKCRRRAGDQDLQECQRMHGVGERPRSRSLGHGEPSRRPLV
jgi:hypothetical protein